MVIDGVVIKINSLKQQTFLGNTAKFPHWAVAYKYSSEMVSTILEEVFFQTGRTGVITPVASLRPVHLDGTIIQRASLYNAQEIERLNLHKGDTVQIEKGGTIIPKIVGVDKTKRIIQQPKITFISHCPDCNTSLVPIDALYYCPNKLACPAQLKETIVHFAKRQALNIEVLGEKTIHLLFDHQLIKRPLDLFFLRIEQLQALPGFGKKSAQNLFQSIQQAKSRPFANLLFGLGIRHVGYTTAKLLVAHFIDLYTLMEASEAELLAIPQVGKKIADSISIYFQNPIHREQMHILDSLGFILEEKRSNVSKKMALSNKKFVVSGTFSDRNREQMHRYITSLGGDTLDQLSKKVDFLLVGKKPGNNKLAEANRLGISVIDEETFRKMMEPNQKVT